MRQALVIFFIILTTIKIYPEKKNFDSLVVEGINKIYNIKFVEADRIFKNVIADYPNHPAGKFFLAMIDWWKILLDINNESNDDLFFAKLEDVIFQCDEILEKDPNNVDALFFKGGSIGFRGRLRAFRDSWIKAADDGREAMPLVQKANKLNPNNIDVKLGFGIYDYYASVIPNKYPFIKPLMVFFPTGDKERGIKELNKVAKHGKYAKIEAKYFLMTLYFQFEDNYKKAEEFAKELTAEFPDNPLFQRYLGRTYVKTGDYYTAYNHFSSIYNKCKLSQRGYNAYARREASYYIGFYYKLNHVADSAMTYFRECAGLSKKIDTDEESGFRINSVMYLGMLNDQLKQREKAVAYYNELLDMRDYGNSHESAKRYLEKPYGR